jgi:hypothetical protein
MLTQKGESEKVQKEQEKSRIKGRLSLRYKDKRDFAGSVVFRPRPANRLNRPLSLKATRARRRPKPPEAHGIRLEVVKPPSAKRGFVLSPRRWVVETAFGWTARLRRLVRDYERLADTLRGTHQIALAILLVKKLAEFLF